MLCPWGQVTAAADRSVDKHSALDAVVPGLTTSFCHRISSLQLSFMLILVHLVGKVAKVMLPISQPIRSGGRIAAWEHILAQMGFVEVLTP